MLKIIVAINQGVPNGTKRKGLEQTDFVDI